MDEGKEGWREEYMCGTMNEWMIGRMDMSIDGRKNR